MDLEDFRNLGLYLEGFFFGMISGVNCQAQVTKAVQYCSILAGLYSGIFVMYSQQHHSKSQQSTDKAKNILFYALWVLYALSVVTIVIDILVISWPGNMVSMRAV